MPGIEAAGMSLPLQPGGGGCAANVTAVGRASTHRAHHPPTHPHLFLAAPLHFLLINYECITVSRTTHFTRVRRPHHSFSTAGCAAEE